MMLTPDLPVYACHKKVRAAPLCDGGVLNFDDRGQAFVFVRLNEQELRFAVTVPRDIFARGEPSIGDYLVIYEDGYRSWSPKAAFEGGYARARPRTSTGDFEVDVEQRLAIHTRSGIGFRFSAEAPDGEVFNDTPSYRGDRQNLAVAAKSAALAAGMKIVDA